MTKTFEPTYETLVLTERLQNGDAKAIKPLWEHVFPDVPFDATRPLEDVGKDLAKVFDAYTARRAAEEAERDVQAKIDATAQSIEMITEIIDVIIDILKSQRKRR